MITTHEDQSSRPSGTVILVVAASADHAHTISGDVLDQAARIHVVVGGSRVVGQALSTFQPDVVLCHADLAGAGRGAVLESVRRSPARPPVIVLLPPDSEAAGRAALAAGAVQVISQVDAGQELQSAIDKAVAEGRPGNDMSGPSESCSGSGTAAFARALEGLYMCWQPLVRSDDGSIYGYEALVRSDAAACPTAWHLLDLATRLGRMAELEARILDAVVDDLDAGGLEGVITVNVSLKMLRSGFMGSVGDPLRRHADRVVLEVSEEGRIDDVETISQMAQRARVAGYRIAIDDLGTGCDYLARLLSLEPDIYKLDRLALAGCDTDQRKQRYVRAIVAMAHGEGALVVAEGIERAEEAEMARCLGGDLLQGYLLGRPHRRTHWIEHGASTRSRLSCG